MIFTAFDRANELIVSGNQGIRRFAISDRADATAEVERAGPRRKEANQSDLLLK